MESEKELLSKIEFGRQEFQTNTMFIANWLKCNYHTRIKLCPLITESNTITGTDIQVLIDWDIPDNECHIGMGNGPTFSTVNI